MGLGNQSKLRVSLRRKAQAFLGESERRQVVAFRLLPILRSTRSTSPRLILASQRQHRVCRAVRLSELLFHGDRFPDQRPRFSRVAHVDLGRPGSNKIREVAADFRIARLLFQGLLVKRNRAAQMGLRLSEFGYCSAPSPTAFPIGETGASLRIGRMRYHHAVPQRHSLVAAFNRLSAPADVRR